MKKFILVAVAATFFTSRSFCSDLAVSKSTLNSDTITLKQNEKFKYSGESVITCSEKSCLNNIIETVNKFSPQSYYLVEKISNSQWVIKKEGTISTKSVPKSITILEGGAQIMGKKYGDRTRVVIVVI
ncbi:hypothetical protein IDJ77_26855 [Mucilaginibacter sp. ZT4R22]|uniref:NlpE-like protein n=1 Tax=Mucilaginibacter pankratovii TaxID=2772110 RepID=A0ABR7WYU3_9SPHI|nr:hypothetical protein [Mucilaginibacter pankratovii]MBD1367460.1 hypothetical protein [Mucilaginibacter pankratovii]